MQAHQRMKIVEQTSEKDGDGQFFRQIHGSIVVKRGVYRKRGNVLSRTRQTVQVLVLLQPLHVVECSQEQK